MQDIYSISCISFQSFDAQCCVYMWFYLGFSSQMPVFITKQIVSRFICSGFIWLKMFFPFEEGQQSLLLFPPPLPQGTYRVCVQFCKTRVSAGTRPKLWQPSSHCPFCLLCVCVCVTVCASHVLWILVTGCNLWRLWIAGLYWIVYRVVQPDGSVYRVGKSKHMACPPQQIQILLVGQRFSYSLLLKLVPYYCI